MIYDIELAMLPFKPSMSHDWPMDQSSVFTAKLWLQSKFYDTELNFGIFHTKFLL